MIAPQSDSLQVIDQALDRMAECPGFAGVVLATADGLVLAGRGTLQGDTAAACAASLALESGAALGTLEDTALQEILIWTDNHVWYLARMPSAHWILAASKQHAHAGALRLATRREFAELDVALLHL